MIQPLQTPAHDDASSYIAREKSSYITKAARSVTVANIIAPLLCYVAFREDADPVFSRDTYRYKVRFEFDGGCVDYRGLYGSQVP